MNVVNTDMGLGNNCIFNNQLMHVIVEGLKIGKKVLCIMQVKI